MISPLIIGICIVIGIAIGSFIVSSINYKKIFLKKIEFLENEYNIPKPLIYSLYNLNNRDGFLSLWRKGQNVFFALIPAIFTGVILIIATLIILYATNYGIDYITNCVYSLFLLSFIPGSFIIQVKIKKILFSFSNKFYRNIPLDFKYSKITFEGSQKNVNKINKYLMKFYKQVKPFYNSFRFNLFTIQSDFNYYFVYLRSIGYLSKSKKILDFLLKAQNISIIIDNRKITFNEFKQVLLNNFFCVFYYFNYYGCSSNFLDDFQEFENSDITKNGYKFKEIKETDFLKNGGTQVLWQTDYVPF